MLSVTPRPRPQRGFSLVEVLIAASLLLIVAVGVLPLFTRAISNNQQGQQSTDAIHRANSELEDLMQMDFNATDLTVPPGQTELLVRENWDSKNRRWVLASSWSGNAVPEYERTVRVRQYNLDQLRNSVKTIDWDELPGGAIPAEVHLKELEVTVRSSGAAGGAAARQLTLKTLKAF